MRRNVFLQGELGERFGQKFVVDCDALGDIFKCINANRPSFRSYLAECQEKGIDFSVEFQGETVDEESLLIPVEKGDVTVAIVPAGSKKIGKIIAAAFLVFVVLPAMGLKAGPITGTGPGGKVTLGDKIAAGAKAKGGTFVTTLATNLALTGLQEIMAQDPSIDDDAPSNYMLDGDTQNITEGDPIPILYGRLKIPGKPIAVDIKNYSRFSHYGYAPKSSGALAPDRGYTEET